MLTGVESIRDNEALQWQKYRRDKMLKIKNKKGEQVAELKDEDTEPTFIKDKKEKKDGISTDEADKEEET